MRALQRKHVGSINPAIKGSILGGLVTKQGEVGGKLGRRVRRPSRAAEGGGQHLGPQAARPGRAINLPGLLGRSAWMVGQRTPRGAGRRGHKKQRTGGSQRPPGPSAFCFLCSP